MRKRVRIALLHTVPLNVKMNSSDSDTDSEVINFCDDKDTSANFELDKDKGKNPESAYEYELLSHNGVIHNMMNEVYQIVNILMVSEPIARCLLNHYKWDKEQLLDDYYNSQDLNVFFQSIGVENPTIIDKDAATYAPNSPDCGICFTLLSETKSTNLLCGHQFCANCWCQYITVKILDDGEGNMIKCPDPDCKMLIDDEAIMELVSTNVKERFQMLMTNTFIMSNPLFHWCRTPDCEFVIRVQKVERLPVLCKCGIESCFECGEIWHDSVTCELLNRWIQYSKEDPETNMWIQKNSKKCPKCTIPIEKNGGCNHMTCKSCRSEFCWLCMEVWHSRHSCNHFEPPKEETISSRFSHYSTRYQVHTQSLRLECGLYDSIESKMKDLQGMASLTRNEVIFLKSAAESLRRSRQILISTYVFAYYSAQSNQLLIFEDNQRDLELATESLSQCMEEDITKESMIQIKQRLQEKYNYCDQRRKVLLDHIQEGYEKGYWQL